MDTLALTENLRRWRWREAMAEGVPPPVILPNVALEGIVRAQPPTLEELARVPGVDREHVTLYGTALVNLVLEASDLRGPPTVDLSMDDSGAGSREALRALLSDLWGAILTSAAWSMACDEPIPTASGKSHLIIDAVTPAAISYRAGKGGPTALTRREVLAAAKRVLLGGGRAFSLEELAMENSSHIAVFLSLAPHFETGYDRRVTIRARLDLLGEDVRAALAATAVPSGAAATL